MPAVLDSCSRLHQALCVWGPFSSQELMIIRNDQQRKEFAKTACDLFPDAHKQQPRKHRMSAAKIKSSGNNPQFST